MKLTRIGFDIAKQVFQLNISRLAWALLRHHRDYQPALAAA